MSAEAFEVDPDHKLTVAELQQMLSDAFSAGCDLGFSEALRAAKRDIRMAARVEDHIRVIEDIRISGINVFDETVGFEKWVKAKGGKT
jgi:hypothetical protein